MSLPKLPRNRLVRMDVLHLDLVQLFQLFSGQALDPPLCRRLARNIVGIFEEVDPGTVFQTLMQYEGRRLSDHWCDLLARQFVARSAELEQGVLQLFDRPARDEWVALEVYRVRECVWREDSRGLLFSLYCLTGHPAGHTLEKKFPEAWTSFLAYRIGYSRRMYYEYEPGEMTGMRFWAYLLSPRRDPTELDFDDWRIDSKMKRDNQSILKLRRRFEIEPERIPDGKEDEYSCPFEKEEYCSQCRCSVRECRAAYNRERTHVRRPIVDGRSTVHR